MSGASGDLKLEWDYSDLLSGDLDKQIKNEKKVIRKKIEGFVSKWRGREDYLKDEKVLKEALSELDDIMTNFGTSGDVGYYLWLRKMKDQTDEEVKAKYELVNQFDEEMSNDLVFFVISLGKIEEDKRKEFLKSGELGKYKHYLERVFRKSKFILSEEVEKVLNLKGGPAYSSWVRMLSEILSKEEREVFTGEKKEVKGFSEIVGLFVSADSKIRDSCAEAFNDILEKNVDVAVAQINALLKDKKVNDELRGYSRADEARIVGDDIDFEFVDDLIDAVVSRFDISKRFYELKAKLLGKEKLKYHDRVASWGKISKEVSYGEAVEIVGNSFSRMDKEFGEIFEGFVKGGAVDVYPAKGKRQGAFCSWGLNVHPIQIMLNYTNLINDVVTFAHESGHGINHVLMKKQSSFDFGVPMAVAEVSSNFAESVVFEDLLNKIDDEEERLAFMVSRLGDLISSVSRQVACYRFERELHESFREKGNLSREDIGEIFHRNMKAYMGDFVDHPKSSYDWWTYWSHIRDYFYVYSYASGALISNAMIAKYKEDKEFVFKIKEFLGFGKSLSPRDSFASLGIDINKDFWLKGLEEVDKMLDETWRLAEKLGKIK